MKVLIVASIYPPDAGGPAIHAEASYRGFPEIGIKTGLVRLSRYMFLPRGLRHLCLLLELLLKAPFYDILYGYDALGVGYPTALVSALFKKKFVLRVGGDVAWERDGSSHISMLNWYERGLHKDKSNFIHSQKVLEKADLVIVPSALLKDLYINHYGITESKIAVVPNPVPKVPSVDVAVGKNIIFASRLTPYKNLSLVFRVLSRVFPKHPELRFLILGEGPERGKLEALAHSLGISDQIIFRGRVSQEVVLRETAQSLLVLAPALTEFNPNYLLQGIAYGKPFLVSRENGLPFEVREDFVFDALSEEELEQKLLNLLDKGVYEEALEWVKTLKTDGSWEECLLANKSLLEGVLGPKD